MSNPKAGSKTGRRERHLARQAALREAKALRRKRAAIHRAMGESAKMRRSKRKGTRDFEANMTALGFKAREGYGACGWGGSPVYAVGRRVSGDVLAKYEAIS